MTDDSKKTDNSNKKGNQLHIALDIERSGDRLSDHIMQIGLAIGCSIEGPFFKHSFCFQPPVPTSFRYWWVHILCLFVLAFIVPRFHWLLAVVIAILLTFAGIRLIHSIMTHEYAWGQSNIQARCYNEFWRKHPLVLDRINGAALPARQQWHAFYKYMSGLTHRNPDAIFLSDNPAADLMRIDLGLVQNVHGSNLDRYPVYYSVREYTWLETGRIVHDGERCKVMDPSERIKGLPKPVQKGIYKVLDESFPHTHWAPDDARRILAMHFLVRDQIDFV